MSDQVEILHGDPPSPHEATNSFSRVARAGDWVLVGGTTSIDPSGVVVGADQYEQTILVLRKIEHELSRLGAGLSDVVQTRLYVTDISRGADVGRAHGEVFAGHEPLMTMVEVSGLFDPRMLVEAEAVAFAPRSDRDDPRS